MGMVFCRGCGKEIHETALACPHCGAPQKVSSSSADNVPDGVRGWSWGAFFLNWVWAIGNRVWWGLLAIIPYVGFIVAIYLGIKGRELAWQSDKWDSVEHFQRVQKKWSQWAVGIVLVVTIIGILAAIAIPAYSDYKERVGAAEAIHENEIPAATQQAIEAALPEEQIEYDTTEVESYSAADTTQLESNDSHIETKAETSSTLSPSFDCSKATTNAEVMICNSPELAKADVILATVYSNKYQNSFDKDVLRAEQNIWRSTQRDSCADEVCMLQAYKQRIDELDI